MSKTVQGLTPCLTVISDYNQYMGGVDLTDQHFSYYSLTTHLRNGGEKCFGEWLILV